MATIKELEANREKLRKYDELKEWKDAFGDNELRIVKVVKKEDLCMVGYALPYDPVKFPDNIKAIIINALQKEIEKLDEE